MPVITDANVLIDYAEADITILTIYAEAVETVYVPSVVVDEVKMLTAADCEHHGLVVVDEPFEVMAQAASNRRGPLSFQDRVCLELARGWGATCVTNEKPLRKTCQRQGVPCKWGLQLMVELVRDRHLEMATAFETVEAIHTNNPMFISSALVERFKTKVKKIAPSEADLYQALDGEAEEDGEDD